MPARGPMPKPDVLRQRTNSTTGVEQVVLGSAPARSKAPKMSREQRYKFHKTARSYWDELLAAPQASMYLSSDWHRLRYVVLPIVDRLARALDDGDDGKVVALSRELRQQERDFGLTPDSRQRMGWQLQDPAGASVPADEPSRRPRPARADPRLHAVN